MNNKIIKYLTSFFLFFAVLVACEEEQKLIYYDKGAKTPSVIETGTITVENSAGKSVLRYKIPVDDNLLYVRAEYEPAPGVVRHAKSSRYTDTLAIEGFAAAGDYEVKLFSIGKNEKESGPVTVTVSPLTPPVVEAFPSLEVISVFGGIEGNFTNLSGQPLKIVLMVDSTGNEPEFMQSFMIDNPSAKFSVRNLPAKEMRFLAYLEDRWGNKTDTKTYILTPMFEEALDKTLWKEFKLPSDFQNTLENNYPGYRFVGLFSDIICPWGGWSDNFIPAINSLPSTFTIDLGVEARLSRFNMVPWWSWLTNGYYPRKFEVYGAASRNPGDDLMGGDWTLIGKFESWKPSGDDPMVFTDDDVNYLWPGGENFDVKASEEQPDPYFPVRMVRFRIMETWNSDTNYSIDELFIWGEVIK
ncbi:MAG: DUF4959 domain-containing protein [Tannerella sp.]|jgi:hypothetical protein|nr:DUF4959 domain-containing protein [Tannerella sp.]